MFASFGSPRTLRTRRRFGFSKRAVLRAAVRLCHAARDADKPLRGRERLAVRLRRLPVDAPEARGERAEAAEADREADLGDAPVGVAQERGGALEPARQQVLVRRLTER